MFFLKSVSVHEHSPVTLLSTISGTAIRVLLLFLVLWNQPDGDSVAWGIRFLSPVYSDSIIHQACCTDTDIQQIYSQVHYLLGMTCTHPAAVQSISIIGYATLTVIHQAYGCIHLAFHSIICTLTSHFSQAYHTDTVIHDSSRHVTVHLYTCSHI